MEPDVPLVIPEVNARHLAAIGVQRARRGWDAGGAIVTNANCAATGATVALAPLHEAFGVEAVIVTTLQAISGAGYPGIPSLDILGNVIPYIADEESKIEREIPKMLGTWTGSDFLAAELTVSAQANRVPVEHGHLTCLTIKCRTPVTPAGALEALCAWRGDDAARGLPSSPERALAVFLDDARPQPRRDVTLGRGMTVSVGRVRADPVFDIRLVALAHNTVRGAAGGLHPQRRGAGGSRGASPVGAATAPRVIVAKFGGTSLGNADAIRRSAEIVRGRLTRQPVVVVSAMAGVTDALFHVADQAVSGQAIAAMQGIATLRARHFAECDALLGEEAGADVCADLSVMFDELASLTEALSVLAHMTPRSLDAVAATGEMLSSRLVVAVYESLGIPATLIDPRQLRGDRRHVYKGRAARRRHSNGGP